MPRWWPFGRGAAPTEPGAAAAEREAFQQATAALQARQAQQMAAGATRQALLNALRQEAEDLASTAVSPADKGRLRALDEQVDQLRQHMLLNLNQGRSLEMAGQVDAAIPCYEAAVADQIATRFPYEHLRIIYRRRRQADAALRVCRAAVANPFLDQAARAHFRLWSERLAHESGAGMPG